MKTCRMIFDLNRYTITYTPGDAHCVVTFEDGKKENVHIPIYNNANDIVKLAVYKRWVREGKQDVVGYYHRVLQIRDDDIGDEINFD